MWQEIAILLTGICTIAYLGRKVYRMFTTQKSPNSPCGGCSGCTLKNQIQQQKECPDKKSGPQTQRPIQ